MDQPVFPDKSHKPTDAEQSDLPAALIEEIRTAKKYPEGRLAHIEVKTAAHAKIAQALLAIKAAN